MQMLAAGVSGDLTTWQRTEWSWKASAFAIELESDKNVASRPARSGPPTPNACAPPSRAASPANPPPTAPN